MESWLKPAKNVLLTGAGFTKDFGGYLGQEMWAQILSQPEVRESPLRKILLNDDSLNYETLYNQIRDGSDSHTSFPIFSSALNTAYAGMDERIVAHNIGLKGVCRLIRSFKPRDERERAFLFTLNQDLFVERFITANDENCLIRIPGLHHASWFRGERGSFPVIKLKSEEEVEEAKRSFCLKSVERLAYIKLHGSYRWSSQDGSDGMVIGTTKDKLIAKEPLLKWYFELFKSVLSLPGRNLLVIGYGFGDQHINKVIQTAIESCGLRLFVVSPMRPTDFRDSLVIPSHLRSVPPTPTPLLAEIYPENAVIWDGVHGYYQARIDELTGPTYDLPPEGVALVRALDLNY